MTQTQAKKKCRCGNLLFVRHTEDARKNHISIRTERAYVKTRSPFARYVYCARCDRRHDLEHGFKAREITMNSIRDKVRDAIRGQLSDLNFVNWDDYGSRYDDLIANIADDVFMVMGISDDDQDSEKLGIDIQVRGGVAEVTRKTSGFSVNLIDYDNDGEPEEITQEWEVEDREGFDAHTKEKS